MQRGRGKTAMSKSLSGRVCRFCGSEARSRCKAPGCRDYYCKCPDVKKRHREHERLAGK
jgi:hypothetical protein